MSPSLASNEGNTVTTPYYTITLPSNYRKSIRAPKSENSKSVLIAFDNRFMKTASITIEASPGEDIDILTRLNTLKEKVARKGSVVETLPCTNSCKVFYALINNQRKSEHFVLLDSGLLRVDIHYIAEEDIDSARAFILSIAQQIHPMTTDLSPNGQSK